jgi:hypothetical protein
MAQHKRHRVAVRCVGASSLRASRWLCVSTMIREYITAALARLRDRMEAMTERIRVRPDFREPTGDKLAAIRAMPEAYRAGVAA